MINQKKKKKKRPRSLQLTIPVRYHGLHTSLQGTLLVCDSFEFCIFKHVSRDFNVVAHELAQLARREESTCLWNGVSPPAVSLLVHNDSMYLA